MSDQGGVSGIEIVGSTKALEKAAETSQLGERAVGHSIGGGITPPYPPEQLAALQELNGTHAIAIGKKAHRMVGFGFEIVPHPRVDPDEASEEERERAEDFWFGRDTIWKVGPAGTTSADPCEVFELAKRDHFGIGWDAIELIYGADDELQGLAHVPAKSVRKRKDSDNPERTAGYGYVQERNGETRFFGEAPRRAQGERYVDRDSGDISSSADGVDNPGNDLLFIPNPSPLSLWYGIPDWVAEIQTIMADRAAREYNRSFFEYDAIPQIAVIVEGGTLSDQARDDIRTLVEDLRNKEGRGVAVLDAEQLADRGVAIDGQSNVQVRIEKLSSQGEEDMAFSEFRRLNEHDIAKVHEVPPILLGVTETSNRSNSQEQIRDFVKDVIEPLQERFAGRIYRTIHQDCLDVHDWTIEFHTRGAEDERRQTELATQTVEAVGDALTVNQALALFDIEPRDDTLGEMLLSEVGGSPGVGDVIQSELDGVREDAITQATAAKRIQTGAALDD